jgi:hypothetical protein
MGALRAIRPVEGEVEEGGRNAVVIWRKSLMLDSTSSSLYSQHVGGLHDGTSSLDFHYLLHTSNHSIQE